MLNIITALLCEAHPIISAFRLKNISTDLPFQIYKNDQINLIISGIGKISTANAIGYLHATNSSPAHSAWLNIGIAGHASYEINTGFIAHKIIDQSTQQSWFPPIIFDLPCTTDQLTTVDKPSNDYKFAGGVDMEASAFYSCASRFTTNELVQSYKVVSDNPQTPVRKFSTNEVTKLISNNMADIQIITDQLLNISNELSSIYSIANIPDKIYSQISDQIRMTHSEKLKIKKRISKLNLINPDALKNITYLENIKSVKEIIITLDKVINNQEMIF